MKDYSDGRLKNVDTRELNLFPLRNDDCVCAVQCGSASRSVYRFCVRLESICGRAEDSDDSELPIGRCGFKDRDIRSRLGCPT